MPITLIQNQTTLEAIIAQRFAKLAPADFKRVQEATLKVNPQLKGVEPIRPGQVVIIPDIPGLNPHPDPASRPLAASEFAPSDAVRAVPDALAQEAPLIQSALDSARAEVEATVTLSESDGFKRLIGQNPAAVEIAKTLDFSLKDELSNLEEAQKNLPAGIGVLQQDLEALMKRLG